MPRGTEVSVQLSDKSCSSTLSTAASVVSLHSNNSDSRELAPREASPPPDNSGNVKVVVRIRPVNAREEGISGQDTCMQQLGLSTVQLTADGRQHSYSFDEVLGPGVAQEEVFQLVGRPAAHSVLQGYNACCLAYGQTGAGKTHTMHGDLVGAASAGAGDVPADAGLVPRMLRHIFTAIEQREGDQEGIAVQYTCRVSCLQIYNEQVFDLLVAKDVPLALRLDARSGVYVENLVEREVVNVEDAVQLLLTANRNRKIGETRMNRTSSRSHCIFSVRVDCRSTLQHGLCHVRSSTLHMVDLAGLERVRASGASGAALVEAAEINVSLSALGRVISKIVDAQKHKTGSRHIPYRDSKLTFLLQDSLGGNAKTAFIANVTPSAACASESLSTLQFACRAQCVKNRARVNASMRGGTKVLQAEVQRLQEELQRLRGGCITPRMTMEFESLKRRFEASEAARRVALSKVEMLVDENSQLSFQCKRLDEKLLEQDCALTEHAAAMRAVELQHMEELSAAATLHAKLLKGQCAQHEAELSEQQRRLAQQYRYRLASAAERAAATNTFQAAAHRDERAAMAAQHKAEMDAVFVGNADAEAAARREERRLCHEELAAALEPARAEVEAAQEQVADMEAQLEHMCEMMRAQTQEAARAAAAAAEEQERLQERIQAAEGRVDAVRAEREAVETAWLQEQVRLVAHHAADLAARQAAAEAAKAAACAHVRDAADEALEEARAAAVHDAAKRQEQHAAEVARLGAQMESLRHEHELKVSEVLAAGQRDAACALAQHADEVAAVRAEAGATCEQLQAAVRVLEAQLRSEKERSEEAVASLQTAMQSSAAAAEEQHAAELRYVQAEGDEALARAELQLQEARGVHRLELQAVATEAEVAKLEALEEAKVQHACERRALLTRAHQQLAGLALALQQARQREAAAAQEGVRRGAEAALQRAAAEAAADVARRRLADRQKLRLLLESCEARQASAILDATLAVEQRCSAAVAETSAQCAEQARAQQRECELELARTRSAAAAEAEGGREQAAAVARLVQAAVDSALRRELVEQSAAAAQVQDGRWLARMAELESIHAEEVAAAVAAGSLHSAEVEEERRQLFSQLRTLEQQRTGLLAALAREAKGPDAAGGGSAGAAAGHCAGMPGADWLARLGGRALALDASQGSGLCVAGVGIGGLAAAATCAVLSEPAGCLTGIQRCIRNADAACSACPADGPGPFGDCSDLPGCPEGGCAGALEWRGSAKGEVERPAASGVLPERLPSTVLADALVPTGGALATDEVPRASAWPVTRLARCGAPVIALAGWRIACALRRSQHRN